MLTVETYLEGRCRQPNKLEDPALISLPSSTALQDSMETSYPLNDTAYDFDEDTQSIFDTMRLLLHNQTELFIHDIGGFVWRYCGPAEGAELFFKQEDVALAGLDGDEVAFWLANLAESLDSRCDISYWEYPIRFMLRKVGNPHHILENSHHILENSRHSGP